MESFNCEGGNAMLCTPTPASQLPAPACKLGKCQIKLEQAHDYYTWTKWVNCQTGFNGFETVFSIAISERRAETNETLTMAIETGVKGFFSKPSRNASRKKKSFSRQISLQGTHKSLLIHEQDF